MVKRKYKDFNWWLLTIFMVAGSIGTFGLGGLFFGGALMNTVILNWLPLGVHKFVGVVLMLSGFGGLITSFVKK